MIPEIGFASQSVSGRDRFPPRTEVTEALPTSLRSIKKATNVDMCELSSYPLFRWWTTTWLDVKWCENSRGEFAKMNKVVEPSCRGIECCPEHVHVYVASWFAPNQGQLFHTISRCLSLIKDEISVQISAISRQSRHSSHHRHLTFAACQLLLQGLAPRFTQPRLFDAGWSW